MKKSGLIFVILIVVLLVSGQSCERREKVKKEGVYIGGSDGINIQFMDDAPSATGNFQGIGFPVEVQLTNNGEAKVGAGSAGVRLVGAILSNAFTGDKKAQTISTTTDLLPLDDAGAIPDTTVLSFGDITLSREHPIGPMWSPTVMAQACYSYKTNLHTDDLCIPGGREEIGTPACEVDSSKNLLGKGDVSAGPVQVSELVESRVGSGVRIKMVIENKGGGTVVKETNVQGCLNDVNLQDVSKKDRVLVTVNGVDSCTFSESKEGVGANTGYVRLTNGRGTLRCTKSVGGSGSAYTDTLTATLDYNYVEQVSKTITIEKA